MTYLVNWNQPQGARQIMGLPAGESTRRVVKRVAIALIGAALAVAVAVVAVPELLPNWSPFAREVQPVPQQLSDSAFAALSKRLSERPGYFSSDNLVSNETGYLHPISLLDAYGARGGIYLGVGPDQNYSYMAHVRPAIAFMVDIRREAALQHLLYKDIMSRSRNRMEYLALLLGKEVPEEVESWSESSIGDIMAHLDSLAPSQELISVTIERTRAALAASALRLDSDDLYKIGRIQRAFFSTGLETQYESLNRSSRRNYPTWRTLILATDQNGVQQNYLAREDLFQVVRELHKRNLVVPVTADLAGPHGVREIGRWAREHGQVVSFAYLSNVEYYLMRSGTFHAMAENFVRLPTDSRSVMVRSHFNNSGYFVSQPSSGGDAFSEQLVQSVESFAEVYRAGGYRSYRDVVSRGRIEPQ